MWLIVLNGPNVLSSNLSMAARKLNVHVANLSDRPQIKSEYFDMQIKVPNLSAVDCVRAIKDSKIHHYYDIVVIDEALIPLAKAIADEITDNEYIKEKMKALSDSKIKTCLREKMINCADNFPWWKKVSIANFEKEIRKSLMTYKKVIVKPLHGYQGIGVRSVQNVTEIIKAKEDILAAISVLKGQMNESTEFVTQKVSDLCLIEEYLDSSDYVVDAVISRGDLVYSAFCEKAKRSLEYNEDRAYFTEHDLTDAMIQSANSFLKSLARAYPALVSIVHAEFRIQGKTAKFIDIAFRSGGSGLSDKIHFYSSGISLYEVWLDSLMDLNKKSITSQKKKPVILYLGQVTEGGVVKAVPCAEESIKLNNVTVLFEYNFCKVGDMLTQLPNYSGHTSATIFRINGNFDSRQQTFKLLSECDSKLNPYYKDV